MSGHTDPAEAVVKLLAKTAGIKIDDAEKIEVMWDDPEFRTQAERTDALIKMKQAAELPTLVVWEKWGATPVEIERWKEMRDTEREEAMETDPVLLAAKAMGGQPPDGKIPPGAKGTAADPQKISPPNGLTK
jgi:hypothetical protein